jgi:hypothetical protein
MGQPKVEMVNKNNKSAGTFYRHMAMADRFNLSVDIRKRLFAVINEPLDDLDFIAISDQHARIVSLFGISPEEYGVASSEEFWKSIERERIASN